MGVESHRRQGTAAGRAEPYLARDAIAPARNAVFGFSHVAWWTKHIHGPSFGNGPGHVQHLPRRANDYQSYFHPALHWHSPCAGAPPIRLDVLYAAAGHQVGAWKALKRHVPCRSVLQRVHAIHRSEE